MKQNRSEGRAEIGAATAQSRLRRLTFLARAALLIERLTRALAPAAIVADLFVAVSWTGVWLGANGLARFAGTAVFLGLLLAASAPLRRFVFPSAADARAALDAQSAEAPAATLADALANGGDPQTLGLWRLHLRRAEKNASNFGWSSPRQGFGPWTVTPWALWPCSPFAPPLSWPDRKNTPESPLPSTGA